MLFEVCTKENPRSHFISTIEEIDFKWFEGASSAGVCGATHPALADTESCRNHCR